MGIPVAKRWSHVTGQRPAYAAKSSETSRTAKDMFSRLVSHLFCYDLTKWANVKICSVRLNYFSVMEKPTANRFAGFAVGSEEKVRPAYAESPEAFCIASGLFSEPVGISVWGRQESTREIGTL